MDVDLRTFPSSDEVFAAYARDCLAVEQPRSIEALQALLRQRYPAAVVRPQAELARHERAPVWYAFRYGSVVPPGVSWDEARARATIDDERRIVDLTPEFAAIVEAPVDRILGHRLEEFTNPADPTVQADLAGLWEEFVRVGVLASTIRYNFADGSRREVAYRLVADSEGPGRHGLRVRPVERDPAEPA